MLNRSQQFEVLGLFAEVWHQLDGYRTGLYRNGDEDGLGLTSLVALLDTKDPEGFIKELRLLGGLIDGSEIDPEDVAKEDTPSRRAIQKLIAQLAAPDYATRHSATTKLVLIGGPALKFVERAEKSEDSVVAGRARNIATRIRQKLYEERESALDPALLSRLEPQFIFREKAEMREGRPVHIIEIRTKQSDTKQSDTVQKNVGRTQRFLALMNGKRLPEEDHSEHQLVSLAIALQPSHLNMEWRLPVKEIKRILDEIRGNSVSVRIK